MRATRGAVARRASGAMVACVLALALIVPAGAFGAAPAAAPDRVPVLIVDGGLGDDRFFGTHWLGAPEVLAAENGLRLVTSAAPTWWEGAAAPDTYVLSASDGTGASATKGIGVAEIAWAIDQVTARHTSGKVVLVAQGAAGLQARRYLGDLGSPTQSSRADVVGLVLLGVPNGGTSYQSRYPDLDVWGPYAAGGGFTPDQLLPGSATLAEIDAAGMPAVVKTLVVQGQSVRIAEAEGDGVLTTTDAALAPDIARTVDTVTVRARASESWSLRDTWFPKTKKGGALSDQVEEDPVEALGPLSGYATAPDVRRVVRTFYETWFSGSAPTTHMSSRLVVDVSGSMLAVLGGSTRLDAAKRAISDFMDAAGARASLDWSVPEDFGLIAFNESAFVVSAPGASPADVKAGAAGLVAKGNTNIGAALEAAIASFDAAPRTTDAVIVLLSDGLSTAGMSEQQILEGPVRAAAERGIRIETILLGTDVDAKGQQFLTQIASAAGGSFHSAQSQHELRRDFLRARFAGLGELFVDAALTPEMAGAVQLGAVAEGTRLLEIAVLTESGMPAFRLLRDGVEVPADSLVAGAAIDGLATRTLLAPPPGTYTLQVDGDPAAAAHVFAARQVDAFRSTATAAVEDNTGVMLLVAMGVLAALAVVGTVVASVAGRKRRTRRDADDARASGMGTDEKAGE